MLVSSARTNYYYIQNNTVDFVPAGVNTLVQIAQLFDRCMAPFSSCIRLPDRRIRIVYACLSLCGFHTKKLFIFSLARPHTGTSTRKQLLA
jgi:hypothetical protein